MKSLREMRLDDRSKLLLAVAVALVLLLIAALLPLAFRTGGETPAPSGPAAPVGEKRRLFADYWILGAEESGIAMTKPEAIDPETEQACEALMRDLLERYVDDRELHYTAPTGSEYTYIRDADGTEVLLCRLWLEARGDWQNWVDTCFDAETGEVYYLYLSRECLANRTRYADKSSVSSAVIADHMAQAYGWTLRWLADSGDGTSALFTAADGTACYQIDCRSYDTLLDIKICCR